jgi:molecular chaperone GrpE (heat shock protein)
MWQRLRSLFAAEATTHASPTNELLPELLESMRKLTRAQTKMGVRFDDLDKRLTSTLTELAARFDASALPDADRKERAAAERAEKEARSKERARIDDLLDALDALDRATDAAGAIATDSSRASMIEGLAMVSRRLERILGEDAVVRVSSPPLPLDGELFRIVGTEARFDLPRGAVIRVVHAAARRGSRLYREGAVVVNDPRPPHRERTDRTGNGETE